MIHGVTIPLGIYGGRRAGVRGIQAWGAAAWEVSNFGRAGTCGSGACKE